ncbi:MAG: polyprenol phosphomannose-dependent alpha 1,6 mannosyltransferase MptB [Propioniciclava sp.]
MSAEHPPEDSGAEPAAGSLIRTAPAVRARLRSVADDLGAAIREPAVVAGTVATLLLALGSLTPAYLPQVSPFWPTMRALMLDAPLAKVFGTVLVLAAVGLLVSSWLRLRHVVSVRIKHWAVLVWWSLPLLPAPPIFSHDAYSYAAHGWLIQNGLNPYATGPGVLPGGFADQVAWVWRFTPSPYGPLSLEMSHWLVLLAQMDPYLSAVLMRIPALIGVVLIVVFLPRIAELTGFPPRHAVWFSTINPLLIIDFVGGAHNDALMMGFVIWGLYLGFRGHLFLGAVAVGLGMAVKQPALLAAYPLAVIGSGWASWRIRDVLGVVPRVLFSFAVTIGVFVAVSLGTGLGFGWINAMGVPGQIISPAPFSLIGRGLQLLVEPDGLVIVEVSQLLGTALAAAVLIWLALRWSRTEPLRFLAWGFLAVAILGPSMQTWYLLWGALLLPVTESYRRWWRVAAVATAIILVYGAVNLAWRNGGLALALSGLAALSAWFLIRRRTRRTVAS